MYTQEIKLKHNEIAATIDVETGEVKPITKRVNNIPDGKSKLDYDNFSIINNNSIKELSSLLSNEELGIILKMIERADFNSNSLKPLSDETSIRCLGEYFNIGKNKVSAIFKKLFELGVYAHVRIHEEKLSEYWILNPYISWKGRLKNDSIFIQFANTKVAKLLS